MAGYRFFNRKHMIYNAHCPKCSTDTWANERPGVTWYAGKHFYDLENKVVGVKMNSGLIFCHNCWLEIQSSVDENGNDMA